jgi:PAS domain S-box-containing protein
MPRLTRKPIRKRPPEEGDLVGTVGAALDTERMKTDEAIRKSQEQLRDSEERYRALFEHNPLMIFTVDENGITRSVNQEGARQLGYRSEDLVGRPVLEVFHENDRAAVQRSFTDCLRTPDKVVRWEFRKVRRTGEVLWVREIIRPVRSRDSGIVALIVCEDITEWKRAQQALSDSEERYRQMFENNPLPMYVYDPETLEFLAVNDSAVQAYGYSREEFLGMTIKEIQRTEDIAKTLRINDGQPGRARVAGPLRHTRKDGTLIQVEVNSHGIDFGGRRARVVLINDVTERKKAEQALLHAQKLESVGLLAGGIAHDFNNLLMGVLGNTDLALQALDPGSRIEVHIQQIKNASLKAAELCRQLLAYSGRGRFDLSFLELNATIKDLMTLLEHSIHKGIALRLDLDPELPPVLGDKVQIQQVIMNLVINSSEAIGDGEGEIVISTKAVRADHDSVQWAHLGQDLQDGEYVLFEVQDTGCGMGPETLQRIFDPFFTTKFTGRGLGLAAVLGIVKGHAGAVRVDSEEVKGTTFKILLPAQKRTPLTVEGEKPDPGDGWKGEGTILVIDDEEAVRAVAELMLPTLGFGVLVTADGYTACEILREHEHEVVAVLLDLTMPRMDGARALQELRKIKPGVKVLLMSGFDEKEAVNRVTNEGFDSFLQKPFGRKQLQEKLKAMLGAPRT